MKLNVELSIVIEIRRKMLIFWQNSGKLLKVNIDLVFLNNGLSHESISKSELFNINFKIPQKSEVMTKWNGYGIKDLFTSFYRSEKSMNTNTNNSNKLQLFTEWVENFCWNSRSCRRIAYYTFLVVKKILNQTIIIWKMSYRKLQVFICSLICCNFHSLNMKIKISVFFFEKFRASYETLNRHYCNFKVTRFLEINLRLYIHVPIVLYKLLNRNNSLLVNFSQVMPETWLLCDRKRTKNARMRSIGRVKGHVTRYSWQY